MKREKKFIEKKYVTLTSVLLWISIGIMIAAFWKTWCIWIGLGLFLFSNVLSALKCCCPYCGSRKAIREIYSNADIKRCPNCKRELHVK